MAENTLLRAWSSWRPASPPFVFDSDRDVLDAGQHDQNAVVWRSWEEATQAPDFGVPNDTRLHLGLLPFPFCGDLERASIYILLLNPGLGPHDYFGEYEVPEYRDALLANLQQQSRSGTTPFLFLDPQFAWHGGFTWWHGKLEKVILRLAVAWNVSFAEARKRLGSELACIELLPYHSAKFRDPGGWLGRLQSVDLARRYVQESVLPRVRSGQAIAIVTRQVGVWNLPEIKRVVTYSPSQTRAAHLTPASPGGKAILEHLGAHD